MNSRGVTITILIIVISDFPESFGRMTTPPLNHHSSQEDNMKQFELLISKEDFKFSAAHFVSHGVSSIDRYDRYIE